MLVLICYDVNTQDRAGRRRLRRIAKACEGYGNRVQYSIFECQVDATHWAELQGRLLAIVDRATDSIRFYFLGEGGFARCEHHGIKPSFDLEGPLVL